MTLKPLPHPNLDRTALIAFLQSQAERLIETNAPRAAAIYLDIIHAIEHGQFNAP